MYIYNAWIFYSVQGIVFFILPSVKKLTNSSKFCNTCSITSMLCNFPVLQVASSTKSHVFIGVHICVWGGYITPYHTKSMNHGLYATKSHVFIGVHICVWGGYITPYHTKSMNHGLCHTPWFCCTSQYLLQYPAPWFYFLGSLGRAIPMFYLLNPLYYFVYTETKPLRHIYEFCRVTTN